MRAWVSLTVLVGLGGCTVVPEQTAERFEVTLDVRPDGSVDVHEEITVRSGAGATAFERIIANDRTDTLTFESASIDGRALVTGDPGNAALSVAGKRNRLFVRWEFLGSAEATHLFALRYRAVSAVGWRGARGTLRLQAIGPDRRFSVRDVQLRLRLPADAAVYGTPGIAEADWRVARTATGIDAARDRLAPGEGATVMAEFSVDRLVMTEPRWQVHADRGQELMPAFFSGGLFILVIGAGVLWILRWQFPRLPGADRGERAEAPAPLDGERLAAVRGLQTSGVVCLVLAVAVAIAIWLTLPDFGLWPQAISAGIFVVGVAFLLAARRL